MDELQPLDPVLEVLPMNSGQISRSKGFSLIELLVAIAFISVLMVGMLKVYATTINTFASSAETMGANRTKRWAMTQIEDDLQSAGYFYYYPGREFPSYVSVNTTSGQNALMLLPNQATTYNTLDPATNAVVSETVRFDELQFLEDQPVQIRARLASKPTVNNQLDLTVLSGALSDVHAGDFVILMDETYEMCMVASVNTAANTVALDTTAAAEVSPVDGKGTGATRGLNYLTHQPGTGVIFVRPLQVVRFTILPLALDPSSPTSMVPCLVKDQTAYPADGTRIVWPAANAAIPASVTRTIIAENVSGQPTAAAPTQMNQYALRIDISPNNGTTWSRAGAASWTDVATNLNTWLGTAGNGRAPYTSVTDSQNPIWYRNIPALFKVDLTTRTFLRRADPKYPTQRAYGYRSQTLICQPRNFSLSQ